MKGDFKDERFLQPLYLFLYATKTPLIIAERYLEVNMEKYTFKDWERDVRRKEKSDFVNSIPQKAKEFWKNEKKTVLVLAPRLFCTVEMIARYKLFKMASRQPIGGFRKL